MSGRQQRNEPQTSSNWLQYLLMCGSSVDWESVRLQCCLWAGWLFMVGLLLLLDVLHGETPARHRPERQYNPCVNRRKQCSPNETKSNSNATPMRKRQNNPTNGHSPRRMKPTHTHLTYTRMRPHTCMSSRVFPLWYRPFICWYPEQLRATQ